MLENQGWRGAAAKALMAEHEADAQEYDEARIAAEAAIQRVRDISDRMRARIEGAKALQIDLASAIQPVPQEKTPGGEPKDGAVTARDIILTELSEHPGMKAADLKLAIERRLGREIHYKTPGMTLYRLANEGLVRREGHRWYAVTGDQRGNQEPQEQEFDL